MDTDPDTTIVRNDDGTLTVPVVPPRRHDDDDAGDASDAASTDAAPVAVEPTTQVLHPGEGGYDEALARWDQQQNPDGDPAVSTASGREQARSLVHAVADSDAGVAEAVADLDDADAAGEALRHVLVGGVHSVEDFAAEVADAEGGDPLPPHQATKVIGEILAELD